jgi:uncharacterized membrane protein YfhO
VPAGPEPAPNDSLPTPVPGRVVSYAANRVAIEVDAPAAGVVVLNEKMLPGWHAEVDGRAARGFRANVMLRAVHVPAGHHVITWSYAPPRYGLYLMLWLAGVAAVIAALVATLWARRRVPMVASPAS